jgi:thiamine transport system substrate-binding protein
MKKLLLLLILPLLFLGCQKEETPKTELTIYTYDSLAAEWGLLPLIKDKFETDNSIKLNIITFADTGVMLNQLISEKNNPRADIILGLDNINFPEIEKNNLLKSYQPTRLNELDDELLFDNSNTLIPFDYGYVGFVYDSEKINFSQAVNLKDLADQQIIIEQAGLSSPGTQLMFWTKKALSAADYQTFWEKMATNALTAPDWSTAYYSMFLEGEAPIVLSYLTSPAYHIDQEQVTKYKAIPIKEGYLRQVEGMGIVQDSELAKKFIDYMLTNEVQNQIATTQWMFPVLGNPTALPAAYQQIITPQDNEVLSITNDEIANNYSAWLDEWNKFFHI